MLINGTTGKQPFSSDDFNLHELFAIKVISLEQKKGKSSDPALCNIFIESMNVF